MPTKQKMPAKDTPEPERRFRGKTTAERAAKRKQQLRQAALDLISEEGWRSATMTAICRKAGLTERYFYESYANRDALLVDLIDQIADEIDSEFKLLLQQADQFDLRDLIQTGSLRLVEILLSDKRKASIALLEGIGNEAIQIRRREILYSFELLLNQTSPIVLGESAPTEEETQLISTSLVGAIGELLVRKLEGRIKVEDSELASYITELTMRMMAPANN